MFSKLRIFPKINFWSKLLNNNLLGPETPPPYNTINFIFWIVFYLCINYAAIMRFKWLSNCKLKISLKIHFQTQMSSYGNPSPVPSLQDKFQCFLNFAIYI